MKAIQLPDDHNLFHTLDFDLPPDLEASEPPEARGLARDEVRLMVSYRRSDRVVHSTFRNLPDFLDAGDALVINTSGTMNAALSARRADGTPLELRLSTSLPDGLRAVEVRRPVGTSTEPFRRARAGETLRLPAGGMATLQAPYVSGSRLWTSTLDLPEPLDEYLEHHGFPIRYGYVREDWPLDYYQTVYATERGSAEMPSAGRAFTAELIARLVANGVQVAPLLLHTGVASLEDDEPPYEEHYRVPPETARLVNAAHASGRRVVAVGTTVVRALETVTGEDGVTRPGEGWTGLIVTPERGVRAVDALLTGLHEPRSTHLAMLEAVAGREHLEVAYEEALRSGYLWHEFGDLHLIL
ncbi:MAG TPA: S-adenosylmethionine:tRNA ribosyltransferase-isomerase [Rubrobacteraceae bacterium]|nr:S-adenosylmethionine:tRNA ribosyltransferase-isomerase [Rubrobacteraceae bacterium]